MHLMIDMRENLDEVFLEETSKNPKQIKLVVSSYFNAWKNLKKSCNCLLQNTRQDCYKWTKSPSWALHASKCGHIFQNRVFCSSVDSRRRHLQRKLANCKKLKLAQ